MRDLILEEARRRGMEMPQDMAIALAEGWEHEFGKVPREQLRAALRSWGADGWPSPAELHEILRRTLPPKGPQRRSRLERADQHPSGQIYRLDGPPATPAHLQRWPDILNAAKFDAQGHLLQDRVMAVEVWWKPLHVALIEGALIASMPQRFQDKPLDDVTAQSWTLLLLRGEAQMAFSAHQVQTLQCPVPLKEVRRVAGVAVGFCSPITRRAS
ncbi:MAG: hypothetical protein AAFV53_38925 [Myxococcota bacterium]